MIVYPSCELVDEQEDNRSREVIGHAVKEITNFFMGILDYLTDRTVSGQVKVGCLLQGVKSSFDLFR